MLNRLLLVLVAVMLFVPIKGMGQDSTCSISGPGSAFVGQGLTLTAETDFTAEGYYWLAEGSVPEEGEQSSITVTYAEPGEYTVELYAWDSSTELECQATRQVTVIEEPPPPIPPPTCTIDSPPGLVTISAGGSITFSGRVSSGADERFINEGEFDTSLSWSFPGGNPSSSTAPDVVVTYNSPGTYTAVLQGFDEYTEQECQESRQVTVLAQVVTLDVSIVGPTANTTIDSDGSLSFSAEARSVPPGANIVYDWSFQGPGASLSSATGAGPHTVAFLNDSNQNQPGTATVTVRIAGDLQTPPATATASVNFTVRSAIQPPDANFSIEKTAEDTVSVTATVQDPGLFYQWQFGPGASPQTLAGQGEFGPIIVRYSSAGTKTIGLTVQDPETGLAASVQDSVEVQASPEAISDLLESLADPEDMGQRETSRSVASVCSSSTVSEDCARLIEAAEAGDTGTVRQVLRAVKPEVSTAGTTSGNAMSMQMGMIGSRIVALRQGARSGLDISGLSLDIDGNRISGRHLQGMGSALLNGGAASADGADFGRLGVFVSGRYTRGRRDATLNTDGFRYRVNGLTLGADYRLRHDLILGAALGYSDTRARLARMGGKLDFDGLSGTFYGTWYDDQGFFIDSSFTYGRGDYSQSRNINYTLPGSVPTQQTFNADFNGSHMGLTLNAGYEWRLDNNPQLALTPTLRLQYVRIDIDGFREQARTPGQRGSEWAVEIDDQKTTSFTSSLGLQASYTSGQTWGVLIPFAQVEWVHEFEKSNDNVTGRFISDLQGTTFSLPVDNNDSNYFNVGAGVSAQLVNGTSGFVNYQRILGYSDLSHYSVNAGVRFEF